MFRSGGSSGEVPSAHSRAGAVTSVTMEPVRRWSFRRWSVTGLGITIFSWSQLLEQLHTSINWSTSREQISAYFFLLLNSPHDCFTLFSGPLLICCVMWEPIILRVTLLLLFIALLLSLLMNFKKFSRIILGWISGL